MKKIINITHGNLFTKYIHKRLDKYIIIWLSKLTYFILIYAYVIYIMTVYLSVFITEMEFFPCHKQIHKKRLFLINYKCVHI